MFSFLNKQKKDDNETYLSMINDYRACLKKYAELEARVTAIEMFHDKYKKQVRRKIEDIEDSESKDSYSSVLVPV